MIMMMVTMLKKRLVHRKSEKLQQNQRRLLQSWHDIMLHYLFLNLLKIWIVHFKEICLILIIVNVIIAIEFYIYQDFSLLAYYTCKDDVIARIHCPERQLFDEDARICNDYRKIFCGNRPINERGNDPCKK